MPTYTAATDIYNVLAQKIVAQLTDDTNGLSVNTDYVENALERAESVVDSYVGKLYDVPLDTPVAKNIQHAVLVLAKCSLYKRRPGAIPDEVNEDCDKIMAWLAAVASGEIALDDLTAAPNVADEDADDEVFTKQVF